MIDDPKGFFSSFFHFFSIFYSCLFTSIFSQKSSLIYLVLHQNVQFKSGFFHSFSSFRKLTLSRRFLFDYCLNNTRKKCLHHENNRPIVTIMTTSLFHVYISFPFPSRQCLTIKTVFYVTCIVVHRSGREEKFGMKGNKEVW